MTWRLTKQWNQQISWMTNWIEVNEAKKRATFARISVAWYYFPTVAAAAAAAADTIAFEKAVKTLASYLRLHL